MKYKDKIDQLLKNLPSTPGVYFYYDKNNKLIYIGKAAVLKNRVKSYFVGAHDIKTEKLVSEIYNIKWRETNSVIEALVLESNLIKKYKPKYNIREKDDKSFIQIAKTNEEYPRFIIYRPNQNIKKNLKIKKLYGPYTSAGAVREFLDILRRIFTFRDCSENVFNRSGKKGTACINYHLRLCPGPCAGNIDKKEYLEIVHQVENFLEGKTKRVLPLMKKQMKAYAKVNDFEKAALIRNRIFAFEHINDVAVIKNERSLEQYKNIPERIETYDISNIGKDFAVGSMVVFTSGEIDKSQYRKFRIKSVLEQNDPAMMAEVIKRRFHNDWPKPNLILLDGGKGQYSAVLDVLKKMKIKIPVIAVAKGPSRKGFSLIKNALAKKIILDKRFIESMRDEAHRFAITYHRKLKRKSIREN